MNKPTEVAYILRVQLVVKSVSEARWTVTFSALHEDSKVQVVANYPLGDLSPHLRALVLNKAERKKVVFVYQAGRIKGCTRLERRVRKSKAELRAERDERQHAANIREFLESEKKQAGEANSQTIDAALGDMATPAQEGAQ